LTFTEEYKGGRTTVTDNIRGTSVAIGLNWRYKIEKMDMKGGWCYSFIYYVNRTKVPEK